MWQYRVEFELYRYHEVTGRYLAGRYLERVFADDARQARRKLRQLYPYQDVRIKRVEDLDRGKVAGHF
jgi:hypothetical protein